MSAEQKLFGTAGIRGIFGKKVTISLIIELTQAINQRLPCKNIVIGYDARTSSELLGQVASASFTALGVQVYMAGLCTFPAIANITKTEKYHMAFYITASHNPPDYNGIKILKDGRELTEKEQNILEKEIQKVRELSNPLRSFKYEQWDKIKAQKDLVDINAYYINKLTKTLDFKGDNRTIIIDCANGPMSHLSPKLISKMGFKVITINSHIDGGFPGRLGEPSRENLSVLMNLCRQFKAIGIAHDGDGDRASLIDESGNFIELSRVNAILSKIAINENGNGKIVLSIDSSKVIDDYIKNLSYEVDIQRTKLGDLHTTCIKLIDCGEKVLFAAEPWKPIFPIEWGLWIDGLYGVLKILKELVKRNISLIDLLKDVPLYYSERLSYILEEEKIDKIYNDCIFELENLTKSKEKSVLSFDGVRYDFIGGSWILIRKSGTEPKIRLYLESPTKEDFKWIKSIAGEIEKIIRGN